MACRLFSFANVLMAMYCIDLCNHLGNIFAAYDVLGLEFIILICAPCLQVFVQYPRSVNDNSSC